MLSDGLVPLADKIHSSPQDAALSVRLTRFIHEMSWDTLLSLIPSHLQIDVDLIIELVALLGGFLAAASIAGIRSEIVYLVMTLLYLLLAMGGRPFTSFQWDFLLIEAGFITALYAPNSFPPARLLSRWLLFKLMLMAGVVKIQANCPTWKDLTATEYHFATQCLPTSLAWIAHQAPPLLHSIFTALTFVIEIPAAFLLICPTVKLRRFGVILQILLQMCIALTGNYTFFNILTAVLCIPCWETEDRVDFAHENKRDRHARSEGTQRQSESSSWAAKLWWLLQVCLAVSFLSWSTYSMFNFKSLDEGSHAPMMHRRMSLAWSISYMNELLAKILPATCGLFCCALVYKSVRSVCASGVGVSKRICYATKSALTLGLFLLSALQFRSICNIPFFASPPKLLLSLQTHTNAWHPVSSYGLFRRMTGVGAQKEVARPEVVLSGSMDGHIYHEIHFMYKPGDVYARPKLVVPHQPRLDWQMWFVALGSAEQHPWLLNLIYKLHNGCTSAMSLLDVERYPFWESPPMYIKAELYHYDFTRLNITWSRESGLPEDAYISSYTHENNMHESDIHVDKNNMHGSDMHMHVEGKSPYWHRHIVNPSFVPPLEKGNESLKQYLHAHGYALDGCRTLVTVECEKTYEKGSARASLCRGVAEIRRTAYWIMVFVVMFVSRMIVLLDRYKKSLRPRRSFRKEKTS